MNELQKRRLAKTIRETRSKCQLGQAEAARNARMSQSMWSEVESGRKLPSLTTAWRMARAMGVTLARLFRGL